MYYYDVLYNNINNGVFWPAIIEPFEFIGDGPYRTQSSSSNQIRSNSAWTRELVAWIRLVVILAILLIVSLAINVIQAIWTHRMIHLQSVHWPWTVILVMKLLM